MTRDDVDQWMAGKLKARFGDQPPGSPEQIKAFLDDLFAHPAAPNSIRVSIDAASRTINISAAGDLVDEISRVIAAHRRQN